jgi:hypothetical protein
MICDLVVWHTGMGRCRIGATFQWVVCPGGQFGMHMLLSGHYRLQQVMQYDDRHGLLPSEYNRI